MLQLVTLSLLVISALSFEGGRRIVQSDFQVYQDLIEYFDRMMFVDYLHALRTTQHSPVSRQLRSSDSHMRKLRARLNLASLDTSFLDHLPPKDDAITFTPESVESARKSFALFEELQRSQMMHSPLKQSKTRLDQLYSEHRLGQSTMSEFTENPSAHNLQYALGYWNQVRLQFQKAYVAFMSQSNPE